MNRRVFVVLLVVSCLFTTAGVVRAEHCADPDDRPAVCTVEVYGALAGQRFGRIDLERPIELPLGKTLVLQFEAFDQRQRRFPTDRLAYGHELEGCHDVVELRETDIGRYELEVGRLRGECRIWFWVPGNLNLEWPLVVQRASRESSGYSRAEAELMTQALYQALLGREADPQGLRDTTAEIQRGNLERRLDDILSSSEFRSKRVGLSASALLEQLYSGIFGRAPDSTGVVAFLNKLERGAIREVVMELLRSEEFELRLLEER